MYVQSYQVCANRQNEDNEQAPSMRICVYALRSLSFVIMCPMFLTYEEFIGVVGTCLYIHHIPLRRRHYSLEHHRHHHRVCSSVLWFPGSLHCCQILYVVSFSYEGPLNEEVAAHMYLITRCLESKNVHAGVCCGKMPKKFFCLVKSSTYLQSNVVVPAVPGYDPQRAEGVIGSRLEATASVRDE